MRVNDTLYYTARHYGSAYTMADHETEAHSLYFTASFMPTDKVTLTGTATYNMSESSYEAVHFDEEEISERIEDLRGSTDLTTMDYDFSAMESIASFDYSIMRLGLGAEVEVTPRVTLNFNGDYADLTDNTGYVYGDETGSYFMIRGGARIAF